MSNRTFWRLMLAIVLVNTGIALFLLAIAGSL